MAAPVVLLLILTILTLLSVASIELGVDSRDGFEDPRGPARPIGISV